MAFLNKLNDLAKSLGDMTNDAIGTSKLNGKIREERKAVDELLHEIGAYYYAKHIGDPVEDVNLEALYANIDEHQQVIAGLETELEAMKKAEASPQSTVEGQNPVNNEHGQGVAICPNCAKENAVGTKFCQECGTSLVPKMCPECNVPLNQGAKFCNECGYRVG